MVAFQAWMWRKSLMSVHTVAAMPSRPISRGGDGMLCLVEIVAQARCRARAARTNAKSKFKSNLDNPATPRSSPLDHSPVIDTPLTNNLKPQPFAPVTMTTDNVERNTPNGNFQHDNRTSSLFASQPGHRPTRADAREVKITLRTGLGPVLDLSKTLQSRTVRYLPAPYRRDLSVWAMEPKDTMNSHSKKRREVTLYMWKHILGANPYFIPEEELWTKETVETHAAYYLTFRTHVTEGRKGPRILARTLVGWLMDLCWAITRFTRDKNNLRCGLTVLVNGLYNTLEGVCISLTCKLELQRLSPKQKWINTEEVFMLIQLALEDSEDQGRLHKLQLICAILLTFATTARPSTLAPSDPSFAEQKLYLKLGNIEHQREDWMKFTSIVTFTNFKGHNSTIVGKRLIFTLHTTEKPEFVLLSNWCLILCQHCRGAFGFSSLDELIAFEGAQLQVIPEKKDEPFFIKGLEGGRGLHLDTMEVTSAHGLSSSVSHLCNKLGFGTSTTLRGIRRGSANQENTEDQAIESQNDLRVIYEAWQAEDPAAQEPLLADAKWNKLYRRVASIVETSVVVRREVGRMSEALIQIAKRKAFLQMKFGQAEEIFGMDDLPDTSRQLNTAFRRHRAIQKLIRRRCDDRIISRLNDQPPQNDTTVVRRHAQELLKQAGEKPLIDALQSFQGGDANQGEVDSLSPPGPMIHPEAQAAIQEQLNLQYVDQEQYELAVGDVKLYEMVNRTKHLLIDDKEKPTEKAAPKRTASRRGKGKEKADSDGSGAKPTDSMLPEIPTNAECRDDDRGEDLAFFPRKAAIVKVAGIEVGVVLTLEQNLVSSNQSQLLK
ncbi:hypothetical protein M407DRAFT_28078 [Tulasnella calospora MUT 4182]|uniref:Uncharacterized protein n=1 Tax=Tulasnella calospora MUT 4182 TaxID=1051891 RepID=A0A0C3QCN6_9AGAM|nr:hypothetical protein M407DRAFT_28078 [Tulasnella calospora MUT 4182]